MSAVYKKIDIDAVVKTAIKNFKQTGYEPCVGSCGLGQSATFYAAIKHKIPKSCIKLCQAGDILKNCRHVFTLLFLDEIYLVDLTFSQFLCFWEEDKKSLLVQRHFPDIKHFSEKCYAPLTENFLIVYYRFLTRFCVRNEKNEYDFSQNIFPLDNIPLIPQEEEYIRQGAFNVLQITTCHNWTNEVDHPLEEVEEYGWDWL